MGRSLEGRVAVVTGAGRGIGRAIAVLLAQEGARVVVNDLGCAPDGAGRSNEPAEEVVREIRRLGGEAVASFDSVATAEGSDRIIGTAVGAFGAIDILVNNAGVARDASIVNMSEEQWDAVVLVHLKGAYLTTRAACRVMMGRGWGRIINMSSRNALGESRVAPLHAMPRPNYAAAKAGILGLTRAVAAEVAPHGITCNAVMPRAETRALAHARGLAQAQGLPPLRSTPESPPEDVAPLVAYLATDEAGNITGRTFFCEGGEVTLYSNPLPVRSLTKQGRWTVQELRVAMPGLLDTVPQRA